MNDYKPQREGKTGLVLIFALILTAIIALGFARIGNAYFPAFLQLISVICIVFAIQIITRFFLTSFYYEINDEDKKLSITKILSKKRTLVCSAELSCIKAVETKSKNMDIKEKYPNIKTVNCCVSMFPSEAYYLIADINTQRVAILIEANSEFISHIKERI